MLFLNRLKRNIVLMLLPVITIGVFCLRFQQNFFYYYLPNSQMNDEIIYYKTVEGMIRYGIPQGYFGYNESHALVGTYGAWSPVVYVLDYICGKVFGWNIYTPIVMRIVLASAGFFIYSMTCKPGRKETGYVLLFMSAFTIYARFLASQMFEPCIITMMIMFAAFLTKTKDQGIDRYFVFLSLIILFLTLIRPYFAVLWLIPVAQSNDKKKQITGCLLMIISPIIFFMISHYLTAEYFEVMIDMDWIKLIYREPLTAMMEMVSNMKEKSILINEYMIEAFSEGNYIGLHFFFFYLLTVVLILLSVRGKTKDMIPWIIINVVIWLMIINLYNVQEGWRHLMPFIVTEGILLMSMEGNHIVKVVVLGMAIYLCFFRIDVFTYPMYSERMEEQLIEMNREMTDKISIDAENRWDNTIIWAFSDSGGKYNWNTLYALPAGMGINICMHEYVMENFDNLQSRYIACTHNGDIADECRSRGYEDIYSSDDYNICIYRRTE